MTQGEIDTAEREALNLLDRWNEVTGFVQKHTGYYYELQGVVEDAVHIGIQMVLFKKIIKDEEGNLMREKK